MRKRILSLLIILMTGSVISAQEDLLNLLGNDEAKLVNYTTATFKATKVILGHSVEIPAPGVLQFMISHHFGRVNSGAYEFFGLDQATMRIGFEYGIFNRLSVGIGRSTYEKTYDGYFVFKVLRQSTGAKKMPFTLNLLASTSVNTLKWTYPERTNYFTSRLTYTFQLLLARKFNERFSFQITPSLIHKNLVAARTDHNDIFTISGGGRFKLSKRISINAEYHYILPGQITQEYDNSLSVGLDIETGGHVFQLFFTNSFPPIEKGFLTETQGKWTKGDIYFGFNISRVFTLVKPKSYKE